jgi:hypothetical protein
MQTIRTILLLFWVGAERRGFATHQDQIKPFRGLESIVQTNNERVSDCSKNSVFHIRVVEVLGALDRTFLDDLDRIVFVGTLATAQQNLC